MLGGSAGAPLPPVARRCDPNVMLSKIRFNVGIRAAGVTVTTTKSELEQKCVAFEN
jgi:hypothetical protein